MGRKAKRLRLMQKLAARQAAVNPSVGKENSVAIEELKKAAEKTPEPVVEKVVEPVLEEPEPVVEEKPKPTSNRKKSLRNKSKSSK